MLEGGAPYFTISEEKDEVAEDKAETPRPESAGEN